MPGSVEAGELIIAGTARSMGIEIVDRILSEKTIKTTKYTKSPKLFKIKLNYAYFSTILRGLRTPQGGIKKNDLRGELLHCFR